MSTAFAQAQATGPLSAGPAADATDRVDAQLAAAAVEGEAEALETLLRRHQPWIYALALRMLGDKADAAEATQEAMLKLVTRLAQFRGESRFRTWAYRVAIRTVLDQAKGIRRRSARFTDFAGQLEAMGNAPLELPPELEPDRHLLVEETRMRCITGMLLCLNPDQRLVYVLGDLFDVSSRMGAELLEIQPATFRKRLERARADLGNFVLGNCGLVNANNPCRCPGKTSKLVAQGLVDPRDLVFSERGWRQTREDAPRFAKTVEEAEDAFRTLLLDQPLLAGPNVVAQLRRVLADQFGGGPS